MMRWPGRRCETPVSPQGRLADGQTVPYVNRPQLVIRDWQQPSAPHLVEDVSQHVATLVTRAISDHTPDDSGFCPRCGTVGCPTYDAADALVMSIGETPFYTVRK